MKKALIIIAVVLVVGGGITAGVIWYNKKGKYPKRDTMIEELSLADIRSIEEDKEKYERFKKLFGSMNDQELRDSYDAIFKYMKKKKKPTDAKFMARLDIISKKYNIFN